MASENTISYSFNKEFGQTFNPSVASSDIIIGRVKFVVLDDSDKEKFAEVGGWKAIGSIGFLPFVTFNDPNSKPLIARPLNSNITKYPLENEIVVVKVLVSKEAQNNSSNYKPEYYYVDVISAWNSPEHNAVPDISFFKNGTDAKLVTGKFPSTGDVKRLLKTPGDITLEGRKGGSIRFGSNIPGYNAPWTAKENKPILVIANNQAKTDKKIVARFENVNEDGSSIYMLSGHDIGFSPASLNFDSYNTVVQNQPKQGIVVVDTLPAPQPEKSLTQTDQTVAQPKEVETPPAIPVKTVIPPSTESEAMSDEGMPEREDLTYFQFTYATYIWNGRATSIKMEPGDGKDVDYFDYSEDWIGIAAQFIASLEGFLKTPKFDATRLRAGYGSDNFVTKSGQVLNVVQSTVFTKEDAIRTLKYNIDVRFKKEVVNKIGSTAWERLNKNQKAAIISFAYNAGSGAFDYNDLGSALKLNSSKERVASIIKMGPITSQGNVLQGLIDRRNKEARLYLK